MDTAAGEKKMKKETSTASSGQAGYDHLLKLLMIGDTWAGKSTLVVRYMSNTFQNLFATIGVDFKVKHATIGGKKLRLIICDTEIDLYSTNQDCVKILVGNKIDKESERVVSKREGIDFARQNGYLFMECSAKTGVNEEKCFKQLVDKILEIPSLMAGTAGVKKSILKLEAPQSDASTSAKHRISSGCCS